MTLVPTQLVSKSTPTTSISHQCDPQLSNKVPVSNDSEATTCDNIVQQHRNEDLTTDRCVPENAVIDHEVTPNSTSDEPVANVPIEPTANVPVAPVTCDPVVHTDGHNEVHDDTYKVVPTSAHFDNVMPACEVAHEDSISHNHTDA
ncbi:hypothetical protein V6N11_084319 [Hibiscus sabdariffa]|uniref:Uncharacterized protein n=1 Tax=Hibiscus sabdariffa TaxID=183260 RepID=A0ABR2QSP0_9ROSI